MVSIFLISDIMEDAQMSSARRIWRDNLADLLMLFHKVYKNIQIYLFFVLSINH